MAQQATPELLKWVRGQLAVGRPAAVLLTEMQRIGWEAEVARGALQQVQSTRTSASSVSAPDGAVHAASAQPAATAQGALPEPDLASEPSSVDAGDRRIAVLTAMRKPRVVVFGDVLSAEECDALIAAAEPRLARSLTVSRDAGDSGVNKDRTSDGMFFTRGESELITRVEARIARLLRWPVENGEGLQVLHYRPGAQYTAHHDYFDPTAPSSAAILQRGGQRLATLVIYLNTPERGGATAFPDVGFSVAPRRGNAVFFSFATPTADTLTLHAGLPVLAGEKWIATKWLRAGRFV